MKTLKQSYIKNAGTEISKNLTSEVNPARATLAKSKPNTKEMLSSGKELKTLGSKRSLKRSSRTPKQLSFIKTSKEFGGSLLSGKRKEVRPLSTKHPIHLVLKSEKAKGLFSFLRYRSSIELTLSKLAKKYQIKIYDKSVNSNHIHMVIYFKDRRSYKAWIRVLTSEIVKTIARKTKTKLVNFFTQRPYTKILSWGRQFKTALNYQILNQMEVFGLRPVKKKIRSTQKPMQRALGTS